MDRAQSIFFRKREYNSANGIIKYKYLSISYNKKVDFAQRD